MTVSILIGDCIDRLRTLPAQSFHMCVTSPPYYRLRNYDMDGQIGLEETPEAFIAKLVEVFRCVRDALRDDGTLWLNMGDSYGSKGGQGPQSGEQFAGRRRQNEHITTGARFVGGDIKEKDLMGIPWLLAFALRADGWFLRQEIIWHKPNPMPESVTDRCTRAHEHIFLLSKSPRYFFDAEAISEAASPNTNARQAKDASTARAVPKSAPEGVGIKSNGSFYAATAGHVERRNKRSVWTVGSEPFPEAHFATFPPALVEPCILAGSPSGGFVLDPFGGAGTTGLVAARLGRSCTLIELNPKYARITERRLRAGLAQVEGPPVMDDDLPLFAGEAA